MTEKLLRWKSWNRQNVKNMIDEIVQKVDTDGAKQRRTSSERDRYVTVTAQPDGTAQVRARISARAGAAFDKRLSELAMSVCAKDSRAAAQRRGDALDALTEGRGLSCDCGRPDCPAQKPEEANRVHTVLIVIASEETVGGESEQPGYLEGFGVIDAELVRDMAQDATLRPLAKPTVTPEQAQRYQPTAEVNRWVRWRDLTCRFPGCDRRAAICDLDHTTPFNHNDPAAGGLTLPSGLADYCREHHRLRHSTVARTGGATNNSPTAPACGDWPRAAVRLDARLTTPRTEKVHLRCSPKNAKMRCHASSASGAK